ncbi:MAG: 4'-phosphopantetheinyl transferase superfamily protein [Bifidobacteriaceae bacterium]|jgi:hypothetical protein|nr:4'-phosphopantetheinyl transferase superfamily protein [Bifidobacteriaceae bacterium]
MTKGDARLTASGERVNVASASGAAVPPGPIRVQLVLAAAGLVRRAASALAREIVEEKAREAWAESRDEAPPDRWTWGRTDAGKPHLVELPEFQFSVSHAGPYVGAAFASGPCGLDVEPADRPVDLAVARRFAPDERDYVSSGPPSSQASRFLEIWTKKEAYLKWTGAGVGAGLAAFSVLDPAGLGAVFLSLSRGPGGDLIGWVCARAEFGAAGLREEWSTAQGG